ncbi:MAG: hypothetical protein VR64_21490 [Desulfatitalea sp. BRH_c12]|nr:MAG: hypothetical protein VR64_21490 [Desulfatitalea sp. BRH_c12]
MYLNDEQADKLKAMVRQLEQRTGVRLMTAVVGKSGLYPEIPWKAFACGVIANACMHLIGTVWNPDAHLNWSVQHTLGFVLGTSAGIALLTFFWPSFGRLFLSALSRETATGHYARSLFTQYEMFKTPARNGILLLISLFEQRAVLLPDSGIAGQLGERSRRGLVSRMNAHLRRENGFQALAEGIRHLETALGAGPSDALADRVCPEGDMLIELEGIS